jgi:hypothetical protein
MGRDKFGWVPNARPFAGIPVKYGDPACPPRRCTIVFAALAVTRFTEDRTGWSIRKFVRIARRYRTIQIRVGHHTLTADDPLPPDLCDALALIK